MTFTPEPEVELVNAFAQPYNAVVAAAKTCYSPKIVRPEDMDKDEKSREVRDRIFDSVFDAGHHTTLQHPTFQFALRRVSRQFVWSFLHAHMFYNSEQVSQRYVEVKPGNFATPPLSGEALDVYTAAVARQMEAYHALIGHLAAPVAEAYYGIYPARRREPEKWEGAIHKRVIEVARYVLPVATHAHLYHTVAGITLHRYRRLMDQFDTPTETRIVVGKMVAAVGRHDPLFFRRTEDPLPLAETPEFRLFEQFAGAERPGRTREFAREFDAELGPYRSRLVDASANPVGAMADAVRAALGLARSEMRDEDAVDAVLNPAKNAVLGSTVRVATLSKLTRAMGHAHFTFKKKLSHTADSQDQRHRMVPGTRPILAAQFRMDAPDVIRPPLIEENPAALEVFDRAVADAWASIRRLLDLGVPHEFALYLLPNAFAIRFVESGDLMNLQHKWTTRLCYLAQEEIWRSCVEEVLQVRERFPVLARHLVAPCGLRREAQTEPYCPEGPRYCGVRVWELDVAEYRRAF